MSDQHGKDSVASCICSFCGKSKEEVRNMVSGPKVYICNECLEVCSQLMSPSDSALAETHDVRDLEAQFFTPKEIKAYLDDYVIGQDRAKRVLAVAVYNHYKRIGAKFEHSQEVELQKSNVILIGPTGSGKTLLAQTLARLLKVPFTIADATVLTEAGYVGEDVETILTSLLHAANYDVEQAQRGIIYIDEIDKISRKSDSASITRDVSGEGVQQALLKIIEGTVASISKKGGRKHPQEELVSLDTTNILFIVGGAFVGLENLIKQRSGVKAMGFGAKVSEQSERASDELLADTQPEDLLKFGLIPELVGRLPVIATLNELGEDDLVRILKEPKNALTKQYEKLFSYEGVRLHFTENALRAVAQKAIARKAGARGLRSVLEEAMLEVMYELPSQDQAMECVVNEEVINQGAYPVIVYDHPDAALPRAIQQEK